MNWGHTLWDQVDNLSAYSHKALDHLDRYANFLKDRASVELDYAKQLNMLIKKYQYKKCEPYENELTSVSALNSNLKELQGVANQHERMHEQLKELIGDEIQVVYKELKEQRKSCLQEIGRLQQNLDNSIELLGKSKKEYSKAFKESESAQLKFERADADRNLSRAEVDKAKMSAMQKAQSCEDAKTSYALQLRKTNETQSQHFTDLLPASIEKLREMDESRTRNLQRFVQKSVEIERNLLPIIDACLKSMLQNCQNIDWQKDCQTIVNLFQTGYRLPQDFQFVDLSCPDALCSQDGQSNSSSNTLQSAGQSSTSNNGVSPAVSVGGSAPNRKDRKPSISRVQSAKNAIMPRIFRKSEHSTTPSTYSNSKNDDFSDLPPLQRCNKLKSKIKDLQKKIEKKYSEKDGLMRMQQCYTDNPNLGNLSQVQNELENWTLNFQDLENEMHKFQLLYEEAKSCLNDGSNNVQQPGLTPQASRLSLKASNSGGSDASSLHRSNSDVSDNGLQQQSSEKSPEIRNSRIQRDLNFNKNFGGSSESEYYQCADQSINNTDSGSGSGDTILGEAKVVYDFPGDSEGTIAIKQNESLLLLEKDTGDGWTKVRRVDGVDEGFVPTSYLDLTWY